MKSGRTRSKVSSNPAPTTPIESESHPSNEDRSSRVAVAAYYKAEARGFAPGYELGDWLAAEAEEK